MTAADPCPTCAGPMWPALAAVANPELSPYYCPACDLTAHRLGV